MVFFLEKIILKSNKYYKHNTILYWDRVTLGVTKGICSNGEEAPLWYLLCNTRKNIEPPSSSISFLVSSQYLSAEHWTEHWHLLSHSLLMRTLHGRFYQYPINIDILSISNIVDTQTLKQTIIKSFCQDTQLMSGRSRNTNQVFGLKHFVTLPA